MLVWAGCSLELTPQASISVRKTPVLEPDTEQEKPAVVLVQREVWAQGPDAYPDRYTCEVMGAAAVHLDAAPSQP